MFRRILQQSKFLRTPRRYGMFELSSGVSAFPMTNVWRELLQLELDGDLSYQHYTWSSGFPTLRVGAQLAEDILANGQVRRRPASLGGALMTVGGSQAIAGIFNFVARRHAVPRVILVGLSYAIFDRLARHESMELRQPVAGGAGRASLPELGALLQEIKSFRPHLVVLTLPNNPSGEVYASKELDEILAMCCEYDCLVLIDKVGELPVSHDPRLNIGRMILAGGHASHVVQVSSFSKTDSVPGFRLGYMIGPSELLEHVAEFQHVSFSNPPTVPLLPVYFTFFARTRFLLELEGAQAAQVEDVATIFSRVFVATTADAPPRTVETFGMMLAARGAASPYARYVRQQLAHHSAMRSNLQYLRARLEPFLVAESKAEAGFNLLIRLEPFDGRDEEEVSQDVLNATGVALLTESCFTRYPDTRRSFWVRVSLATPPDFFQAGIDRLRGYLGAQHRHPVGPIPTREVPAWRVRREAPEAVL